jgi:hypothetical protein
MRPIVTLTGLLASVTALAGTDAAKAAGPFPDDLAPGVTDHVPMMCVAPAGPEYYAFGLVTTKNVPGTGLAEGQAEVSVSGSSPFSVSLGADGSYVYDVRVALNRMKLPRGGTLVAWVTSPQLDRIERIGALDENLRASGTVSWNKFLVVITLEPEDRPDAAAWTGPVAFRGMSRSGMMHTMVGHGALQQENCQAYGYGN